MSTGREPALPQKDERTGEEPSLSGDRVVAMILTGEPIPGTLDYDLNELSVALNQLIWELLSPLESIVGWIATHMENRP